MAASMKVGKMRQGEAVSKIRGRGDLGVVAVSHHDTDKGFKDRTGRHV